MQPELAETLNAVAELAEPLHDPWWIIGSAAAALVGAEVEVADVDVLASVRDAGRLLGARAYEPPLPSPLFRSTRFGRLRIAPLPIEVMAELEVRGTLLLPQTREAVAWGERHLYVPVAAEQIAILERFGREKDLRRAERLKAL